MKAYGNEYKKYADGRAKKTTSAKNCVKAFLIGGLICCFAEGLRNIYLNYFEKEIALPLVSVTLIFITALLSGIGVFDRIAKHAGAGTLVPITGFANAVASCAIDARTEGYILGVGAKIFSIAGPVILYGTAAGTLYGVIYWFCTYVI